MRSHAGRFLYRAPVACFCSHLDSPPGGHHEHHHHDQTQAFSPGYHAEAAHVHRADRLLAVAVAEAVAGACSTHKPIICSIDEKLTRWAALPLSGGDVAAHIVKPLADELVLLSRDGPSGPQRENPRGSCACQSVAAVGARSFGCSQTNAWRTSTALIGALGRQLDLRTPGYRSDETLNWSVPCPFECALA